MVPYSLTTLKPFLWPGGWRDCWAGSSSQRLRLSLPRLCPAHHTELTMSAQTGCSVWNMVQTVLLLYYNGIMLAQRCILDWRVVTLFTFSLLFTLSFNVNSRSCGVCQRWWDEVQMWLCTGYNQRSVCISRFLPNVSATFDGIFID